MSTWVKDHVKSSSPQPCWCIPQPGSCSPKWFGSCTACAAAAWSGACCLLSSRSEGTEVGNSAKVHFVPWQYLPSFVDKLHPQGITPELSGVPTACLHAMSDFQLCPNSSDKIQPQKHNPGTQSSCSMWKGLVPGGWAASRRHFANSWTEDAQNWSPWAPLHKPWVVAGTATDPHTPGRTFLLPSSTRTLLNWFYFKSLKRKKNNKNPALLPGYITKT